MPVFLYPECGRDRLVAFIGPGRSAEQGEVASWVPREVARWCAVQGLSGHGRLGRDEARWGKV